MQISANVILDFRNDIVAYAKSLQSVTVNGASLENSALADGLSGIKDEVALAPVKNLDTLSKEYIEKFADDMKLKGADRFLAMRVAKEMVPKVLEDAMLDIEA